MTSVTLDNNWIVSTSHSSDHSIADWFGSQVKEYIIGNSVTSIGEKAFRGWSGLTSVIIGNSVTSIGEKAFLNCSGLTSVTIPNSVTSIGKEAFSGCSRLISVTIPSSVTSIDDDAFYGCSGLISVHITDLAAWCNISNSDNPLKYAHHLYLNGTEIKDLVIPNSVTSIGQYAFSGCSGLTSVTIPNSVTSIGEWAFYSCYGLTSVTIPNSVNNIGTFAFKGCSRLTSVTLDNNWIVSTSYSSDYSIVDRFGSQVKEYIIGNSVESIGQYAFSDCSGLTSVTIPNSVNNIGASAFKGCSDLTSVTIPNSVTSIGYDAFLGCSGLTSVIIGNSVTSIGKKAFHSCSGLTSVTIPNSVTSIGYDAFRSCSGLTSVTIPNSVTSIGQYAFGNCSSLTSVILDNNWVVSGCSIETLFGSQIKECIIGNSVTSIGASVFANCSNLTSVTIPNSVTSIGNQAFNGCSALTSVVSEIENPFALGTQAFTNISEQCVLTVPKGTKDAYIAKGWTTEVFKGGVVEELWATSISLDQTSVTLDENNRTIKLTATILPNNVTNKEAVWTSSNESVVTVNGEGVVTAMGNGTASVTATTNDGAELSASCDVTVNLQSFTVQIPHGNGTIDLAIRLSGGEATIGASCISTNVAGALQLPEMICFGTMEYPLTQIGISAFLGCDKLTSISIPNTVIFIDGMAFINCNALDLLYIPSSVRLIGCGSYVLFGHNYAILPTTKLIVDADNTMYDSRNDCNAIIHTATNTLILGCNATRIPDGITTIETNAFFGLDLQSITLPSSITKIKSGAFGECRKLRSVVSYIETPCRYTNFFDGIADDCVLYVPAGTKAAYIAKGWTEDVFKGGIIEAAPDPSLLNTLAITDVGVCKGKQIILPVNMNNTENITALQFEMSLPAGVTISKCQLTDRKGEDHTASYMKLANGNYQVTAIPLSKAIFSGTQGAVVNLTLDVDKGMTVGNYAISLTNIELTTSTTLAINPSDVTATLTVSNIKVGDADGNGKISITDAVAIVSHILGEDIDGFVAAAADVDGNGRITITDAVAVVDMILNGNASAKKRNFVNETLDPQ